MNNEKFNSIRNRVALSATEKADMRGRLLAHARIENAKPGLSPFSWMMLVQVRVAAVAILTLTIGGSGVVVASEDARPGNPLYVVKLQVAEPTRLALTLDRRQKAALEVSYADRRLREIAAASVTNTLDANTSRLIAASLEERLEGAGEEIGELTADGEGDEAYSANTELRAVLTTHARILKKVAGSDPARTSALAEVNAQIEEGLADSSAAEPTYAAALADQETRGELQESVTESQESVVAVLEGLREDMQAASTTLDQEDHETLTQSITEVTDILVDAARNKDEGQPRKALELYKDADNRLDELKTLIESEQELGLDLIGGEE